MGYIMHLREKIGHEELLTAGTGVFPVRDGKVLLQRRADNGLWTMHGGAIEIGEVPEDAAKREFFEETGLRANALELIGVFPDRIRAIPIPTGTKCSSWGFSTSVRISPVRSNIDPNEARELKWFPLGALPAVEEISPPDRRVFAAFSEFMKNRI